MPRSNSIQKTTAAPKVTEHDFAKPIKVNVAGLSMLKLAQFQDEISALKNQGSNVEKLLGQARLVAGFTPGWSVEEIVDLDPARFANFIQIVMGEVQGNVPLESGTNF